MSMSKRAMWYGESGRREEEVRKASQSHCLHAHHCPNAHYVPPVANEKTLVLLQLSLGPGLAWSCVSPALNPRCLGLTTAEWSLVSWGRSQGVAEPGERLVWTSP